MADQLPDYKTKFIQQMEQIRRKKQLDQQNRIQSLSNQPQVNQQEPPRQNVLWVGTQYTGDKWRGNLNESFYRKQHNQTHFNLNQLLNPQIAKKKHNMRVTQISEYSNARHNNTVFVNPKNSSC